MKVLNKQKISISTHKPKIKIYENCIITKCACGWEITGKEINKEIDKEILEHARKQD